MFKRIAAFTQSRYWLPLLVFLAAISIEKKPLRFLQPLIDLARDPLLHRNGMAASLFTPAINHAGLPAIANQALELLAAGSCAEYQLSELLLGNEEWDQRITESAFPRRQNLHSVCRLQRPQETVGSTCRVSAQAKEVVLVLCP